MTKLESVIAELRSANEYCLKHTADECPDHLAIPIAAALKILESMKADDVWKDAPENSWMAQVMFLRPGDAWVVDCRHKVLTRGDQ